jgi:hypothetical protein
LRLSEFLGSRRCPIVFTFHAEPISIWNPITETNAVCVIWGIACIAEEQNLFLVCPIADGAWAGVFLLVLELVYNPVWIESSRGFLFFVFDLVFGKYGAWRILISICF